MWNDTLATWAEEEGFLNDALSLLERARSLSPEEPEDEIELRLASVLIGLGTFDRAIETLVPLCHKSRQPEKCVELLSRIPRSWTDYRLVLKSRGYAKTEAGAPREGFAELSAAIDADPSDADALVLRALARLTFGIKKGQEKWNQSRSMKHIRESLGDLYAALRIRPGHDETLRIMKWLVERAGANPEMLEIFSMGGSAEGDLFLAFPHLKGAFESSWRANGLSYERKFHQSAHQWIEAQLAHERAGFKILAARVSIRLADVYLRLLDLDEVAAHLARAEHLRFLINVPLSLDVLAQYEAVIASRSHLEQPTLGKEVEYVWIYDHAAYDEVNLQFLKANYRHRLGDVEGAVECVDLLEPLLKDLPAHVGGIFGIDEVLWVIAILRDAERYDDALRLLDSLQGLPAAEQRSFDLLYMRALLLDVKGESLQANEAYEKALPLVNSGRPVSMAPYVQYAASLLHVGRSADALNALQHVDIERDSRSDRDRLYYYTVSAYVHAANGDLPGAMAAVEKAIPVVEQTRAEISDPASRRSWQGQQHNLFSIAVKLYVQAGKARHAWEVVELSRARTLLDELVGRETVSPEHDAVVADLDTIERAIGLVERDMEQDATEAPGTVLRIEAAARLSALLTPGFRDILSSPSFTKRDFRAVREALLERREVARARERQTRDQASTATGSVLDFAELAGMLKE